MAKASLARSMRPLLPVLSMLLSLVPWFSCGTQEDAGPPPPPPPPPASIDGWTWMSGTKNAGQAGVFGVKGQADPVNRPPGKYYVTSWVDSHGVFWLFGGDSIGTPWPLQGSQNDLWKYDPGTKTWTWVSGEETISHSGVYGTKGVASPANTPGAREWAASWSDDHGGLWLFGGRGPDATGNWGHINDLWRFDTSTGQWTWVSGDQIAFRPGVYGTKGVAAPANVPGARQQAAAWTDSSGKLWLYGGTGWDAFAERSGPLTDLWKFDPRTLEWTWVAGDNVSGRPGFFGTMGQPGPSNSPGGIIDAATWTDADDNLWLFGGQKFGGLQNALWKFDTTSLEWTWISGSDAGNQAGSYGTMGVASASNVPGARRNAFCWPGDDGELLVFGGYGYAASASGHLNDLWRFDPDTLEWTCIAGASVPDVPGVYGSEGDADILYYPGSRFGGAAWKTASGELWLFGGNGFDRAGEEGNLNDLWRFHSLEPTTLPPAGVRVTVAPAVVSVDRTESAQFRAKVHNAPNDGVVWSLDGAGCDGAACGTLSDTGLYSAPETVPGPAVVMVTATSVADPSKSASATVTILDPPVIVTLGPGQTDVYAGESVLFRAGIEHATDRGVTWSLSGEGCAGAACGTISDAGLYTAPAGLPAPPLVTVTATSVADPSKSASSTVRILEAVNDAWAWVSGGNVANQGSVRGEKGVAGPFNVPGSREGAASWTDLSGRLWLFGGESDTPPNQGNYSDLWMYDPATREWTWLSGSDRVNQIGSYGTMGIPDPSNVPGARTDAVTWTGAGGDLWLYGGHGYGILRDTAGDLSDLWRYDIATNEWTWVSGNVGLTWPGFYGARGVPDPSNKPGARHAAVSWTDAAGRLWLFGGEGYDAADQPGWLNDLWSYDPASGLWTWESGSDRESPPGAYGVKGVADPANVPGGRIGAVSWTDSQGRFWLFGGTGWISTTTGGRLNELWRYDPISRQWTWMAGSNLRDQLGVYGIRGVPDPANAPGGRYKAVSWSDGADRLWLFGGMGFDSLIPGDGMLNDLWVFDIATLQWTWVTGSDRANQGGLYGTRGVAEAGNTPGAREEAVSWVDLHGDIWLFGGNGLTSFAIGGMLNDLWRFYRPSSTGVGEKPLALGTTTSR